MMGALQTEQRRHASWRGPVKTKSACGTHRFVHLQPEPVALGMCGSFRQIYARK
jgi:hypothetical protein